MVVARPLCVDISRYQGLNINWPASVPWAKPWDGVARIIMRSSYGTDGLRDDDFEAYRSGAVAAGCNVIGVYHYAYPNYNKGTPGAASTSAPAYDNTAIKARLNMLESFVAKIKALFAQ
jgi:hypothetical protein